METTLATIIHSMKTTNRMQKTPCDVQGCDYVARHKNPIVLKRIIGCHKTIVHGIRSAAAIARDKYPSVRAAKSKKNALDAAQTEMEHRVSSIRDGKCPVTGCTYEYHHPEFLKQKRTLAFHMSRVHGIRGKNADQYDRAKAKKAAESNSSPQPGMSVPAYVSHPVAAGSREFVSHPTATVPGLRTLQTELSISLEDPRLAAIVNEQAKKILTTVLDEFAHCPRCTTPLKRYLADALANVIDEMENENTPTAP